MYYAFVAPDVPAPNRTNRFLYFIHVDQFMADDYDEAFDYDWTEGARKLVENRELQYDAHLFPLVGHRHRAAGSLPNWVQGYEAHWRAKAEAAEQDGDADSATAARHRADDAKAFGEHLRRDHRAVSDRIYRAGPRPRGSTRSATSSPRSTAEGIRLDVFDLINALLKPKGLQLKHMWRAPSSALDFVDTERMNVYILQVMSILSAGVLLAEVPLLPAARPGEVGPRP